MTQETLNKAVVPAIATAALLLLTWPIWRWLWGEWMANDYYSHGILILPIALFLAFQRFRNDKTLGWAQVSGSNYGLVILGVALVAYLYFFNQRAYYLASFSIIGLIWGLTWTFGGWHVTRKLLFPIGFLVLMVPLPFVERATLPLAMFTGVCSGTAAQFLGLDVDIVGSAVTLPNADLVIGAQCSGINSLIALTALMILAAYLLDGPIWGRITLVILAVPLAMLGNIIRVGSLLFVARYYGAQVAFSYYHDYSGPIFFLLVLALMLPLTQLLQCKTLRLDVI